MAGRDPAETDRQLAAVYAQIPDMDGCDGSCWESCGPVPMGAAERARIAAAGVQIPPLVELLRSGRMCPALSAFGRCPVYDVRPVLCRLWGAVEGMRCDHGCRPVGGYLSDAEAHRLIAAATRVGAS